MNRRTCNMNCFKCVYKDCIAQEEDLTLQEYQQSSFIEKELIRDNPTPLIDMTTYVTNRPNKEEYEKARNKKYEDQRKGSPKRKESKKNQYIAHREDKLSYQHTYYENNKEEVNNKAKAHYEANKEEISLKRKNNYDSSKRKEEYELNKDKILSSNKNYYEANKEEIKRKRRERYHAKKKADANKKELSTAI